jgi:hypothetical protein
MAKKRKEPHVVEDKEPHYFKLMLPKTVGNRLFKIRHASGFGGRGGQKAFAKRYGFQEKSWNRWEKGRGPIPHTEVGKLIYEVYEGLTSDYVYFGRLDTMLPVRARALENAPDRRK